MSVVPQIGSKFSVVFHRHTYRTRRLLFLRKLSNALYFIVRKNEEALVIHELSISQCLFCLVFFPISILLPILFFAYCVTAFEPRTYL